MSASLILIASLFTHPAAADGLHADLTVPPGESLRLTSTGLLYHHVNELANGPISIETEAKGWLFSSSFLIRTADGTKYKIKVPKSAYEKQPGATVAVKVPAEATGQHLGFEASSVTKGFEKWRAISSELCTYDCHRWGCGAHTPPLSFKTEYGCGYGTFTCHDTRDVLATYQRQVETLTGKFTDAEGNVVANLGAKPTTMTVQLETKNVSECGKKAPKSVYDDAQRSQDEAATERKTSSAQ
jgi:hypothetical protein